MEPCTQTSTWVHIVIAIFSGLSTLISAYISAVQRRNRADRRWFYAQMRGVHGLNEDSYRRKREVDDDAKQP